MFTELLSLLHKPTELFSLLRKPLNNDEYRVLGITGVRECSSGGGTRICCRAEMEGCGDWRRLRHTRKPFCGRVVDLVATAQGGKGGKYAKKS